MTANDEVNGSTVSLTPESSEDLVIRHIFFRKVSALLVAHLFLITVGVSVAMRAESIRGYMTDHHHFNLIMGVLVASIATYAISVNLVFFESALVKRNTVKVIFLLLDTVSLAVMLSIGCVVFEVEIVVMTLGITLIGCVGIFVFSCNTWCYFFSHEGLAFCFISGLLSSASLIPIEYLTAWSKIEAGCVAAIFMIAFVLDVHRIIILSLQAGVLPTDFLAGTLKLHSDFIWLFVILPIGCLFFPFEFILSGCFAWYAFIAAKDFRRMKVRRCEASMHVSDQSRETDERHVENPQIVEHEHPRTQVLEKLNGTAIEPPQVSIIQN